MVLDQNTVEAMCFGGLLIGAVGRTLLPYLQKFKEAEEGDKPVFQKHYWFTLVYSLITSAVLVIPAWAALAPTFTSSTSVMLILLTSATTGYTANSVANNFIKMKNAKKTKPTVSDKSITSKVLVDADKDKDKAEEKPPAT